MDVKRSEGVRGNPVFTISTPKSKAKYIVQKSNDGFSFFNVKLSVGETPSKLSGMYTTPEKAIHDVKAYIEGMRETATVRRDANTKRREESKNAKKLQSDNEERVQQGSAN